MRAFAEFAVRLGVVLFCLFGCLYCAYIAVVKLATLEIVFAVAMAVNAFFFFIGLRSMLECIDTPSWRKRVADSQAFLHEWKASRERRPR